MLELDCWKNVKYFLENELFHAICPGSICLIESLYRAGNQVLARADFTKLRQLGVQRAVSESGFNTIYG